MKLENYIPDDWKLFLKDEFTKEYFVKLSSAIEREYSTKEIFPSREKIFSAFNYSTVNKTKVILLGQDPYHNIGQANGLAFSVNKGVKLPPSLRNIYKELNNDTGFPIPFHGDLQNWANQGVLLINAIFTVEAHKAGSHKNLGWQTFTNNLIEKLSHKKENLIFILWGNFAQSKEVLINTQKHLVIKSAHPSPLSAYNGFFGSKPFTKTNTFLLKHKANPINWEIPIY